MEYIMADIAGKEDEDHPSWPHSFIRWIVREPFAGFATSPVLTTHQHNNNSIPRHRKRGKSNKKATTERTATQHSTAELRC
jgi:hypothetical protein